jgi:phenylalanyl-tRNA synthetase alpha chain
MARAFASASPERQVYLLVPPEGIPQADLKNIPLVKDTDGFPIAMSNKWLKTEKMEGGVKVVRAVDESAVMSAPDLIASAISALLEGKAVDDATASILKKRKFAEVKVTKSFRVTKGKNFVLERKPMVTDLSPEMLQTGSWKNLEFKPYNFKTLGRIEEGGHLHPLLKVRSAYRQVFLEMGFSEMPTNNFVESSFWNFDALFQPQQHPARDSHDTFFLENPPPLAAPRDYIEKVREMHSKGDADSIGWRYDWSEAEATKTLLRTHTTAVSSRMLYQLAQEKFAPRRYFSIDRVFRNEQPDATHLAEFHQIEGVVCDVGLSLADLMGVVQEFFKRIGLDGLKFKPAYNPYTEPSMEIFAFHKGLSKWVEVGNSGIFRPEMLRPMGNIFTHTFSSIQTFSSIHSSLYRYNHIFFFFFFFFFFCFHVHLVALIPFARFPNKMLS